MKKIPLIDCRLKIADGVIYWQDKREVDGDVNKREFYNTHDFEFFIRDYFGAKVWNALKKQIPPVEPPIFRFR